MKKLFILMLLLITAGCANPVFNQKDVIITGRNRHYDKVRHLWYVEDQDGLILEVTTEEDFNNLQEYRNCHIEYEDWGKIPRIMKVDCSIKQ